MVQCTFSYLRDFNFRIGGKNDTYTGTHFNEEPSS